MSTPGLEFPEFLPPQTVPAGRLQALGSYPESYTGPGDGQLLVADTNPTLGTGGFTAGWFSQRGAWIDVTIFVQFGTSGVNAGNGIYALLVPIDIDIGFYGPRHSIGVGTIRDNSAGSIQAGVKLVHVLTGTASVDRVNMRFPNDGSGTGSPAVAQNSPWTWAASDEIMVQFSYIADF